MSSASTSVRSFAPTRRRPARAFEPNFLACIDFDRPDFPWLFTPASANAENRLRPWVCLIVVRRQDGVTLTVNARRPLPVLTIDRPAVPRDELPDLASAWAWAHAQVAPFEGALDAALQAHPERSLSRLICPRRLEPSASYYACVVPAFEAGRIAGLGQPVTTDGPGGAGAGVGQRRDQSNVSRAAGLLLVGVRHRPGRRLRVARGAAAGAAARRDDRHRGPRCRRGWRRAAGHSEHLHRPHAPPRRGAVVAEGGAQGVHHQRGCGISAAARDTDRPAVVARRGSDRRSAALWRPRGRCRHAAGGERRTAVAARSEPRSALPRGLRARSSGHPAAPGADPRVGVAADRRHRAREHAAAQCALRPDGERCRRPQAVRPAAAGRAAAAHPIGAGAPRRRSGHRPLVTQGAPQRRCGREPGVPPRGAAARAPDAVADAVGIAHGVGDVHQAGHQCHVRARPIGRSAAW